jgi:hypothetical protein
MIIIIDITINIKTERVEANESSLEPPEIAWFA